MTGSAKISRLAWWNVFVKIIGPARRSCRSNFLQAPDIQEQRILYERSHSVLFFWMSLEQMWCWMFLFASSLYVYQSYNSGFEFFYSLKNYIEPNPWRLAIQIEAAGLIFLKISYSNPSFQGSGISNVFWYSTPVYRVHVRHFHRPYHHWKSRGWKSSEAARRGCWRSPWLKIEWNFMDPSALTKIRYSPVI